MIRNKCFVIFFPSWESVDFLSTILNYYNTPAADKSTLSYGILCFCEVMGFSAFEVLSFHAFSGIITVVTVHKSIVNGKRLITGKTCLLLNGFC